jgi:hypothetical protein
MHAFSRKIVALSLVCCVSGAMAAASLSPQVEQAKKILVVEKEQWAYVQKAFADELQVSPYLTHKTDLWCKHHPVLPTALVSIASLMLGVFIGFKCFDGVKTLVNDKDAWLNKSYGNWGKDDICAAIAGITIGLIVAFGIPGIYTLYSAQISEWSLAACLDAVKSFVHKWPEHREKVPHMLQNMFDDLYKQQLKSDITVQQAQKLVEGIMALATVAQIA